MNKKNLNGQPLEEGSSVVAQAEEQSGATAEVVVDSLELLQKKYGLMALAKDLKLPKVKWIVEGLLEEKSPATILGPPKACKTWASLALSIAVVTGGVFLGHQVNVRGSVLYFVGEGHASKISERAAALLKAQGKSLDDLGGHLWLSARQVDLEDEGVRAEILTLVREMKPILVVFDPLARFLTGGDENSAKDMRPILNWVQHDLCKRTAVVIDHHMDKKGASARGTGDFFGFVATQISLEGKGGTNRFKVRAVLRNAEAPEPFEVKLNVETVERDGEKVLDTAELVVLGTNTLTDRKDIEAVVRAKEVIRAKPGISSSALAGELRVGYRRAERLALQAGATMTKEGQSKKWGIPSPGSFRDITVS